jgi:hypothetical protein
LFERGITLTAARDRAARREIAPPKAQRGDGQ